MENYKIIKFIAYSTQTSYKSTTIFAHMQIFIFFFQKIAYPTWMNRKFLLPLQRDLLWLIMC